MLPVTTVETAKPSLGRMRGLGLLHRHPVLTLLVLAIVIRVFTFSPRGADDHFDCYRFIEQAKSLKAGLGFAWNGHLETAMPPGYPVFLAAVFCVSETEIFSQCLQFGLSVFSCYLVYQALLPYGQKKALLALLTMSASPWLAWRAGFLMSETVGVFLCSCMVYMVSRYLNQRKTGLLAFLLGLMAVGILLTVPALGPLALAIGLYLTFESRQDWRHVLALATGAILPMLAWQIHCVKATGSIVPGVLTPYQSTHDEYAVWVRGWIDREDNLIPIFSKLRQTADLELFDAVPSSAFPTPQDRDRLRGLLERKSRGQVDRKTLDRAFGAVGLELERNWFRYHVSLPCQRAVRLWAQMPMASHVQPKYVGRLSLTAWRTDVAEYGQTRALIRSVKAIVSTAGFALFYAYLISGSLILLRSVVSGELLPWAVVLGLCVYTYISTDSALFESRRNLPFTPWILYCMAYCPGRAVFSLYSEKALSRGAFVSTTS